MLASKMFKALQAYDSDSPVARRGMERVFSLGSEMVAADAAFEQIDRPALRCDTQSEESFSQGSPQTFSL